MAIGDIKQGSAAVAAGGFLNIQPVSPDGWLVQTLVGEFGVPFEVWSVDAGGQVKIEAFSGGSVQNLTLIATNVVYYKLKNVDAAPRELRYEGRQIA